MVIAKTIFQCSVCGKEFNRFPSRNRGNGIYCSKQCFGLVHRGENNSLFGIGQGIGHPVSDETREKLSIANRGQSRTDETKQKMSLARIGKKLPLTTRARMSITQRIVQNKPELKEYRSERLRGSRHWNWKGGVRGKSRLARGSYKFREWREAVFRRDNWTCQVCGVRGCYLHPHHILPFADCPEFRFDVNNGETVCVPCHREIHFGGALRASA